MDVIVDAGEACVLGLELGVMLVFVGARKLSLGAASLRMLEKMLNFWLRRCLVKIVIRLR